MKVLDISDKKNSIQEILTDDFKPNIESVDPVDENELNEYHKRLQKYFLYAQKTGVDIPTKLWPLSLINVESDIKAEKIFPILLDYNSFEVESLYTFLRRMIYASFDLDDSDSADVLDVDSVMQNIEYQNNNEQHVKYESIVNEVVKELVKQQDQCQDEEKFGNQASDLEKCLSSKNATLIPFSPHLPFHLLNLQLEKSKKLKQAFLKKLKSRISGLEEILKLQGTKAEDANEHFDFASELVAIDKIDDMASPLVSSVLPEERVRQLRKCFDILIEAMNSYSEVHAKVFVTKKLVQEFSLTDILTEAKLETVSQNPCGKAQKYLKTELENFIKIISALRLSELEINQEYDEDLHGSYFEGFDLSYISEEDFRHFRPMVVIEESSQLTEDPKVLLGLLSTQSLVKIMAVNRLEELSLIQSDDVSEDSSLELAAMALYRRNACVFQGAANSPDYLNSAFRKGLETDSPVLWNILCSNTDSDQQISDLMTITTAVNTRFFPVFEYNIKLGDQFGSHFNVSGNPQPSDSFTSYEQTVKSPTGNQVHELKFSPADFLTLRAENLQELEVLPLWFESDSLISMSEYLTSSGGELSGKIPYIYMLDEEGRLRKVVMPLSWVKICKARFDYWLFMQELGEVNNTRLERVLDDEKANWLYEKEKEIEEMKNDLQARFEASREQELSRSIEKILYGLLGKEEEIEAVLAQQVARVEIPKEEESATNGDIEEGAKEKLEVVIQKDAWVESDMCTSCNDCIDALPSVFKYNSDKQAFVHNPKGGKYAKIVALAEKCPARCIHPGLPQDESEADLEKWIKRASKFN